MITFVNPEIKLHGKLVEVINDNVCLITKIYDDVYKVGASDMVCEFVKNQRKMILYIAFQCVIVLHYPNCFLCTVEVSTVVS